MDNLIRVVIMEANRNISNQSFKGNFLDFQRSDRSIWK